MLKQYSKCSNNIPNAQKIFQMLKNIPTISIPPKYTHIGIFVMKTTIWQP
jgi:hypothetical protein